MRLLHIVVAWGSQAGRAWYMLQPLPLPDLGHLAPPACASCTLVEGRRAHRYDARA